jgi:hypothetical protein
MRAQLEDWLVRAVHVRDADELLAPSSTIEQCRGVRSRTTPG